LNLQLCIKQCNKIDLLHLIVLPQLSGGWQHKYSTKTRKEGHVNEQYMYSLVSMTSAHTTVQFGWNQGKVNSQIKLDVYGYLNK
jgi:hypothetical protein